MTPEELPKKHKGLIAKTLLATAFIALPAGFFIGSTVGSRETVIHASNQEAEMSVDDQVANTTHLHELYAVTNPIAPVIKNLTITQDNKTGWNLSFETENFAFTPENVGLAPVDGQGHAHLYIDGVKITRLYSPNYYLGELDEGQHEILVTLNTNDHKDFAVNGMSIQAKSTIIDMHHSGEQAH